MLLPVLQRARNGALLAVCMNNQKEIGLAVALYAEENDTPFCPRMYDSDYENLGRNGTDAYFSSGGRRIETCTTDFDPTVITKSPAVEEPEDLTKCPACGRKLDGYAGGMGRRPSKAMACAANIGKMAVHRI
jgi:hypothetical protein